MKKYYGIFTGENGKEYKTRYAYSNLEHFIELADEYCLIRIVDEKNNIVWER